MYIVKISTPHNGTDTYRHRTLKCAVARVLRQGGSIQHPNTDTTLGPIYWDGQVDMCKIVVYIDDGEVVQHVLVRGIKYAQVQNRHKK